MNIALTGSHGLIGSALLRALRTDGHRVGRLVRGPARASDEHTWDAGRGVLPDLGDAPDAVVHLAGESISAGRWTDARKAAIRSSRVDGTRALAAALAALPVPPRALLCASAVGFYGSCEGSEIDERAPHGAGFLAGVCREWEAAAEPARAAGIRCVALRFGIVLSAAGGALPSMLPPFRLGLGGRLGSGRQYMSWITLDDAVAAIRHLLLCPDAAGPFNLVAPNPVTNAEFTRTLGRVLRRPAVLAVPAFALRLLLGTMADELLLGGVRVQPARLLETGFAFRQPGLEAALRAVLGL